MIDKLILPWPPSVNTYYRSVSFKGRGCRVLLSKRGREYRTEVGELIDRLCRDDADGCKAFPYTDRLSVDITLNPPNRRKFDIDNRIKATLDALQHAAVFEDDEQVDSLSVQRGIITTSGSAVVVIRWLPGATP